MLRQGLIVWLVATIGLPGWAQTSSAELDDVLQTIEESSHLNAGEVRDLIERGLRLNPGDATRARLLLKRGDLQLDDGDAVSARPDLELAETLATALEDSPLRRTVSIALGTCYSWIGEGQLAVERFEFALRADEASGNTIGQIKLLSNIGLAHRNSGELGRAVESFLGAIELMGDDPEPRLHAQILTNIGAIHSQSKNAKEAKWFLTRALQIMEELGEPMRYVTMITLGAAHALDEEHAEFLALNELALELATANNDVLHTELARVNVGMAHLALKDYAKAVPVLEVASAWLRERNRAEELSIALIGLGIAYDALGRTRDAAEALDEARVAAIAGKEEVLESEALVELARIHSDLTGHAQAFTLIGEALEALHSAHSEEQRSALADFEAKYEARSKLSEIRALETRAAIADLELAGSHKTRNFTALLALVSLVACGGLILLARSRARALVELREEERELASHRNRLQVVLDEAETLRGFLPICSYCKRIRDAAGSWAQPETFFSSRADVSFSRHLCPSCGEQDEVREIQPFQTPDSTAPREGAPHA